MLPHQCRSPRRGGRGGGGGGIRGKETALPACMAEMLVKRTNCAKKGRKALDVYYQMSFKEEGSYGSLGLSVRPT